MAPRTAIFFYNNEDQPWSQGAFANLDGTLEAELLNVAVARFRLDAVDAAAVPEPGSLALLALGAPAFASLML